MFIYDSIRTLTPSVSCCQYMRRQKSRQSLGTRLEKKVYLVDKGYEIQISDIYRLMIRIRKKTTWIRINHEPVNIVTFRQGVGGAHIVLFLEFKGRHPNKKMAPGLAHFANDFGKFFSADLKKIKMPKINSVGGGGFLYVLHRRI